MMQQKKIGNMIENIEKLIVGKREVIEHTLITLLAGGIY